MIKPNTLCMIRGVPQGQPGHEFNGQVVIAQGLKRIWPDGSPIYRIEPVLCDSNNFRFNGCREQWLYPFSDPRTLGLTNKQLEAA